MARNFGYEDAAGAPQAALASIVQTGSISDFLEADDKLCLVGPKGTGKTLLLKRKAIDKREHANGIYIPQSPTTLVDRLAASEHLGARFDVHLERSEAPLAWMAVWKHAILKSVLQHLRDIVIPTPPGTSRLVSNDNAERDQDRVTLLTHRNSVDKLAGKRRSSSETPFECYSDLCRLLDGAPRSIDRVREEVTEISSILRGMRNDCYVFLDNSDEYYELKPALWLRSMYGQFRAIREITYQHSKIHVYSSLRRDVYVQFDDEHLLEYYGSVVPLTYGKEELLEVFANGIKRLDPDLLAIPDMQKQDPWQAFFGRHTTIHNNLVKADESIQNYVFRHSFARPRDMIHIGTVLTEERSRGNRNHEGLSDTTIRAAVDTASTGIARQYLAEIRPMVSTLIADIPDFIEKFVSSNIFTRSDLEDSVNRFCVNQGTGKLEQGDGAPCPFGVLYRLGLLGVVKWNVAQTMAVQHFEPTGQGPIWNANELIPKSDLYFLHPALNFLLETTSRNPKMVVGFDHSIPLSARRL